ncbi:helix-turn-helix transcriptional regulator [Frankia sp. R82]|uniref:helix-turn-helix domain-containing protein n=1 Tax=Frankia sp. R82 TaxID=2950553 RepID=UPI00204407DE|nr:helix-turn-helix transcriptional regulator [Frankia sp. R82]MCM3882928.1 helix-turn-helix transcriptional regulator [Frankia sp. R82]
MPVALAHVRAEARRLRVLGWSYRRIALRLRARHGLRPLAAFRLARGWTQEEAARHWNERWPGSGPVKTGKAWSYWENWPGRGGRAPSAAVLWRLAELYQCRPGELLDGPDFGRSDPAADAAAEQSAAALDGLLPEVAVLGGATQDELPSAASIEALLAGLLSGWVPAA